MNLAVTKREALLLKSALCPDPKVACESWKKWSAKTTLENASQSELRLLPAVYRHLARIEPKLELPQKLRGNARATFTRNQLLVRESLLAFSAVSAEVPIILTKGIAFCVQFDSWSWRVMHDIDFHIPYEKLGRAVGILSTAGWTPKYGMTWASLQHRSSLRRNSWNLTKDNGEIDIHWRCANGESELWLEQAFWSTARSAQLLGHSVSVPSAEFSLAASLQHGFGEGNRGDALQTIVDAAAWLSLCSSTTLAEIFERAQLWQQYTRVSEILSSVGLGKLLPTMSTAASLSLRPLVASLIQVSRPKIEARLLRKPQIYRLWGRFGHRPRVERLLLRLGGPFSRPLLASGTARDDYDLSDCAVMDEIGGPGWSWPEPEHTCFWSDRADNRLLIPLNGADDHFIVLTLAGDSFGSPNPTVFVFANGEFIGVLELSKGRKGVNSEYGLLIPKRLLFGPWVELSFRPKDYKGQLRHLSSVDQYPLQRSLPPSRLRVFRADRMAEHFSSWGVSPLALGLKVLRREQPETAKFDRITAKIAASQFRGDTRLPPDFDPVAYMLLYADLFAAEVDPYEHFINWGKNEGRWGTSPLR
jgi:Uncharacterised nucleotidyltransferase